MRPLLSAFNTAIVLIIFSNIFFNSSSIAQFSNDSSVVYFLDKAQAFVGRNNDSLLIYAQQAYRLASENANKSQMASAKNHEGMSYYSKGQYDKAMAAYDLAFSFFSEKRDSLNMALVMHNQGTCLAYQGQYDKALLVLLEALDLRVRINDVKQSSTINNIGLVYFRMRDFDRALEYYNESAALKEKNNQRRSLANSYNNIGTILRSQNKLDESVRYFQMSLDIALEFQDLVKQANAVNNLAIAYEEQEEYEAAEKFYVRAVSIKSDLGDSVGLMNTFKNYSLLLERMGDLNRSKKALDHANLISDGLRSNHFNVDLLLRNAGYYKAVGNYKKANEYNIQAFDLKISEINENRGEEISNLEVKYDTEKKEQQIVQLEQEKVINELETARQKQLKTFSFVGAGLLILAIGLLYVRYADKKKTNKLLDIKNQELAKLNATKDRLFSIISHDLKSPLSSFHLITKSLSDNWEMLEKEQLKDFIITLRDSSSDVKNMMDNLLKWALSQSQQLTYKPTRVNSTSVADKVIKELSTVASLKSIPINMESKSISEITTDQDFLQIVIRNLLSNALKFSALESKIDVLVEENDHQQIISIQDYGVGMDQSQVDQLFAGEIVAHDIQNSSEKGTGLGLVLCKELMGKMNAQMEVVSEKGKGTIFRLVFSKAA